MFRRASILTAVMALLFCLPTHSQTKTGKNANAGVSPTNVMDQADVRVARVEIQPGAVRSVHTHDDVRFHLFIPVSGKLEISIGSAQPVEAAPGQAFYMKKGTPHGFKNTGSSVATVMEVFIKDGSAVAERDARDFAVALASLGK
jgi:quercetin dioxygenase-like cupin family protein